MMNVTRRQLAGGALASLVPMTAARAAGVPMGNAKEAGLLPDRLARMTAYFKAQAESGRLPGAVVMLARNGKVGYAESFGTQDPETRTAMSQDSMFRIYSMTKPITSVATMMLWEEGRFRLGDPVHAYLPALKDMRVMEERVDSGGFRSVALVPPQRPISIQDLLRHTSGLTYGGGQSAQERALTEAGLALDISSKSKVNAMTNMELVTAIGKTPLLFHPGTKWEYGRSTDVLGALVEAVSGMSLGRFFEERIFKPLAMNDSFFNPPRDRLQRVAQPGLDPDLKSVPDLYDVRGERRFEGGGEGVVSTAGDYMRFCLMLVGGGELEGARILGRKTVEYMSSDHLGPALAQGPTYAPGPGYGFGLGFAVRTAAGLSAIPGSVGEYNWGGAAGTAFWIDPREKLAAVFMMQAPGQRIFYRFAFRSLVYQSLDA
jgi:CubicO group peptidase (beta-lactamase class C family)